MDSYFHHPVTVWKRSVDQQNQREDGRVNCPYCVQLGIGKNRGYKSINKVLRHVVESNAESTNAAHDEAKDADGFYGPDFENALELGPTASSLAVYDSKGRRDLKNVGIELYSRRELMQPEPSEAHDQIVIGSYRASSPQERSRMPPRLAPFVEVHSDINEAIKVSYPHGLGYVPEHLRNFIQQGSPQFTPGMPLPAYMQGVVDTHP